MNVGRQLSHKFLVVAQASHDKTAQGIRVPRNWHAPHTSTGAKATGHIVYVCGEATWEV